MCLAMGPVGTVMLWLIISSIWLQKAVSPVPFPSVSLVPHSQPAQPATKPPNTSAILPTLFAIIAPPQTA